MEITTLLGVIGGLVLVLGSARNEKKALKNPRKSIKDRLFAIGGIIMLIYAILGYNEGGSIFYVFLESFVCIASILMMIKAHEKSDMIILGILGFGLVVTSFFMDQSTQTLRFIFGLIGISLGYTLKPCTLRRDIALTTGSLLIAIFSLIQSNRIFFGLNIFFFLFSAFYRMKHAVEKKK